MLLLNMWVVRNRLIPLDDEHKKHVKNARDDIWNIYQKLKEYKVNPNESMKHLIVQSTLLTKINLIYLKC
jgi:hypothetical protein